MMHDDATFNGAQGEHAVYTGHDVVDEQGQRIGRVVDALYDDDAAMPAAADAADPGQRRPTWLVVDPGLLRAAHYLPVAGSYRTGDGTVVTPWDRDWVKAAVRADSNHVLTSAQRTELERHYSIVE